MNLRHAAALGVVGAFALLAFRETQIPDFAPSFGAWIALVLILNTVVAIPFGLAVWLILWLAGDQRRYYWFAIAPLTVLAYAKTLATIAFVVQVSLRPPS